MGFQTMGFDDLEKELDKAADADMIACKAIDAATPTLEKTLKNEIKSVTTQEYSTGDLAKSIKATKAKVNGYGCFAAVKPTGTDSKGVRNGEKMAYMEYGTSKQEPKPVLRKAISKSEKECLDLMQRKYDEVTK